VRAVRGAARNPSYDYGSREAGLPGVSVAVNGYLGWGEKAAFEFMRELIIRIGERQRGYGQFKITWW